jgi:hypothetical protein
MRLEELIPEKFVWSVGSISLVMAGALFAYEMLRPAVSAYAGAHSPYPTVAAAHVVGWEKRSPFTDPGERAVLVKLPELPLKYQKKVLYLWQAGGRRR